MTDLAAPITMADVTAARARLAPHLTATPTRTYATLDAEVGAERIILADAFGNTIDEVLYFDRCPTQRSPTAQGAASS